MDLSGSMQGAGGVGGLLAVNDTTASYDPTYDGNGNVSEYLDSTGAVKAHYEYDAFGNTTASTGTMASEFFHRFSTKPLDQESGLYYYGYRYYDPVTGRWPSRDPIGERGGGNLYGMVGNDAVGKWDYLGPDEQAKKVITVTEVEKPQISQASIVVINPNDPEVKKVMNKFNVSAKEMVAAMTGGEGTAVVCTSNLDFLKQIEALQIADHSQKVVIIDHGQPRIEEGEKVVPVYPQVGGQPLYPESKNGQKVLKVLTRISKKLIICNCNCGRLTSDNTKKEHNMQGLFSDYKNMCGEGGVSEIFVYSRCVGWSWTFDKKTGKLKTLSMDPPKGGGGTWRRVGANGK